jgi:hypothetical protein
LVKNLAKGDKPLDDNVLFWNIGHVLQILSKHSKICQYKSCAEFLGTHFIFRMAFQILSGKGSNLPVKLRFPVHPRHENPQLGI